MRFESRTGLAALRLAKAAELERILAIKAEFDVLRAEWLATRAVTFSPDQPRDERGRWTDGTSRQGAVEHDPTTGQAEPESLDIIPVGGIPDNMLSSTTQQFISTYCKAGIRAVMPGEVLSLPIAEVMNLAKQGNGSARTCLKLLKQDEYRK